MRLLGEKRIKAALDRFRGKARSIMEDSEALEGILEKVQEQSECSELLRTELEPMLRLARSYARGAYREIDAEKAALAGAAFLYVASPIDLVPDHLPGGLKDDEKVVSWVLERIASELEAYLAWEEGLSREWSEEDDPAETVEGKALSLDMEVSVLGREESRFFSGGPQRESENEAPVAIGQIGAAGINIGSQLAQGDVMRVVASDSLLKGIANGSYQLMETSTGYTGSVTDGSKIVGNLKFDDPGIASKMQAPLAAFQMASAVTLQYYLERIDRQLQAINRQVQQIDQEIQDERFGRIQTAAEVSQDLEDVLRGAGRLGDREIQHLTQAEQRIDDVFHALSKGLLDFQDEANAVVDGLETVDKKRLKVLLDDAGGKRLYQAKMLIFASVVRHRLNAIAAIASSYEGPERAQVAARKVEREHEEMTEALTALARAFRRLHIPKKSLDERWGALGGPEKELAAFTTASGEVGEFLEAPQQTLPALEPPAPMVFEIFHDAGGELQMQYAPA